MLSFVPLVALMAQAPAAQTPATNESSRKAEMLLAEFADCVVSRKSRRASVDRFLRLTPADPKRYFDASMQAADLTCLNQAARRESAVLTMRVQPATFREALYPALYRRAFAKAGPVPGVATSPPMSVEAEFDDGVPSDEKYQVGRGLGDCVARRDPANAHALVVARPYTKSEDAAVAALGPALQGCVSAGQSLRLNRHVLRSFVGEALYKLSMAASATKKLDA